FSSSPEQRGDSGSGNTPPGPGGGLPADAAGLPVDGPPEESGFRALRCGNLSRTARSSGSVSMHSGKHRPAFTSIPPCQAASPSSSPWPRKRGSVPDWNAWGPISGAAGSIRYAIASTAIKGILYSRRGKGRRKRWGGFEPRVSRPARRVRLVSLGDFRSDVLRGRVTSTTVVLTEKAIAFCNDKTETWLDVAFANKTKPKYESTEQLVAKGLFPGAVALP